MYLFSPRFIAITKKIPKAKIIQSRPINRYENDDFPKKNCDLKKL